MLTGKRSDKIRRFLRRDKFVQNISNDGSDTDSETGRKSEAQSVTKDVTEKADIFENLEDHNQGGDAFKPFKIYFK